MFELELGDDSLRHRPKFEIIWVCESLAIIMYSDRSNFPKIWGKT